ncbi:14257_t:CDS:2 [Cetraspora pellucida]|uniref:14257_t:CDS:1 n=1 Tax=Cetraspora pellucida TaxID=1433469 RepID=A0ACA9LX51_9GLOM|nr:14257_t:CDS:2 [Cetraspora pellucida]
MSDIESTLESETSRSTSNMNLHLANEHSLVKFQKDKKDNNNDKPSSSQLSLVVDNHPLDTIKEKSFCCFMLQVDPAFCRPSYKVLRKNILFANTNAKEQIYNLLNETCENVSLTTDL